MRGLVIIFCLLSSPAFSQQIKVRSGAHPEFARLVLNVPAGTEWTLDQDETGAKVSLEKHTGGFDTTSVFDRIDRSYIADVSSGNSNLSITFSCECTASAFSAGEQMIVLDVSANTRDQPTAISGVPPRNFVGTQALRFDTVQNDPSASLSEVIIDRSTKKPRPVESKVVARQPQNERKKDTDTERLKLTHSLILEQIGAAASRGILSPAGPRRDLRPRPAKPQIDTRIFDSSAQFEDPNPTQQDLATNVRVTSSNDTMPSIGHEVSASISNPVSCIDPEDVAIQDWGAEAGLPLQIAKLRGLLFKEFDKLDSDIAVQLAKTYLHYGFGAEARQTLLLDSDLSLENPALIVLADILEFGHSPRSDYLNKFADCDSDLALWAILASQRISQDRTLNTKAALRSASALPMHLRRFIAPELSNRLLSYGDVGSASAALRSVERAPQPLEPIANLAKADLSLANNEIATAQAQLAEIVTSNTEQSVEALIKFVDSQLAEDAEIDEGVATLVEAYALEMRDDPIEAELQRTHVLALGKSGQFSTAFDVLARLRTRDSEVDEGKLRSSVLDLLVRNSDNVEFLEHAFTQIRISPETLAPEIRFKVANRLTELGFPHPARVILNSGQISKSSARTSLLNAKIALAMDRPREALMHLRDQDSDAASLLRAQAETVIGNYSSAYSIYSNVESGDKAQRTAWLSQDWTILVEEASPVFGSISSVAQKNLESDLQTEGALKRATEAISESQDARAIIWELLSSQTLDTSLGE